MGEQFHVAYEGKFFQIFILKKINFTYAVYLNKNRFVRGGLRLGNPKSWILHNLQLSLFFYSKKDPAWHQKHQLYRSGNGFEINVTMFIHRWFIWEIFLLKSVIAFLSWIRVCQMKSKYISTYQPPNQLRLSSMY